MNGAWGTGPLPKWLLLAVALLAGASAATADPTTGDDSLPPGRRLITASEMLARYDRDPEVVWAFGSAWVGYLLGQNENGKYEECIAPTRAKPADAMSREVAEAVRSQDPAFLAEPFIARAIVAGRKLYCGGPGTIEGPP